MFCSNSQTNNKGPPMPDIVESLRTRTYADVFSGERLPDDLCIRAADEIDRLRACIVEYERGLAEREANDIRRHNELMAELKKPFANI